MTDRTVPRGRGGTSNRPGSSPDGLTRKRPYHELTMNGSPMHVGGVNVDENNDDDDDDDDMDMMMDPSSLVVEPLPMDGGDDGDGEYDEELIQIQEEAIRRIQRLWRMTNQERRRQHEPGNDHHRPDSASPSKFSPADDGLDFRSPILDGEDHHTESNDASTQQQQQQQQHRGIFLEEHQTFGSSRGQQNQEKNSNGQWYTSQQLQTGHPLAEHQDLSKQQQQEQGYLQYDRNRHQHNNSLPPYYFHPVPPPPNHNHPLTPQPQQTQTHNFQTQNVGIDNSIPLSPTMRQQPNNSSDVRMSSSSPAGRPDAMEPRTWWDTGDTTNVDKNTTSNNNSAGRLPSVAQTNDHLGNISPQVGISHPTNRAVAHESLVNRPQHYPPLGTNDKDSSLAQSPLQPSVAIIQQHSYRSIAPVLNNGTAGNFHSATKIAPQQQYLIPYPVQQILTQNMGKPMQRRSEESRQTAPSRNAKSKRIVLITQRDSKKANAATTASPKKRADPVNKLAYQKRQATKAATSRSSPSNVSIKHLKHDETYILRMNDILEDAERDKHTHVVSWLSHGRAFRIHIPDIFYNIILPKYFSTTKQRSFTRWLRAWGFERQTEGKDRGAWFHRYFVRGVVTILVKDLTRKQMKDAMEGWLVPGQVPDFYNLSHFDKKLPVHTTAPRCDASLTNSSEEQDRPELSIKTPDEMRKTDDSRMKRKAEKTQCPVSNPKKLRGTVLAVIRQMLSDADEQKFSHIVGWLDHGKAWKVHKRKEFASEIMAKYFDATQLTHISDTLRRWGFQRLKNAEKSSEKNAYYHCLFQRGHPELCRHLTQDQMRQAMSDFQDQKIGQPGGLDLVEEDDMKDSSGFKKKDRSMEAELGVSRNESHESNVLHTTIAAAIPDISSELPPPGCKAKEPAVPELECTGPSMLEGKDNDNSKYVTRIFKMLEESEREGKGHIVGWRPHGRAFGIYDVDAFTKIVLPRYFKASYSSFIRWLRCWGFQRMQGGKDRKCWYHRLFVREVTDLVQGYSRQEMLDAMQDWLPPRVEPDFYKSGSESALADTPRMTLCQQYGLLRTGGQITTLIEDTANSGNSQQTTRNNSTTAATADDGELQAGTAIATAVRHDPKRLRGSFLEDVRQMLDAVKSEGREDIVGWQDHGLAFRVHNKSEFSQTIMARFLKSKQYSYFCDVLRTWGFIRLKNVGKDNGAYFHRLFVRDDPTLSRHLSRNQMKQAMTGWPQGGLHEGGTIRLASTNETTTILANASSKTGSS